ncbi:MAG: 30S ribosomal protein S15 [Parcubacteria group bacterium GW2011_GWF1_52_5]|nr:MAG: 30S ribosomal protein S15 [Parcubacteria group bacterium GW2011_GWF1_52_5]
MLTKRVKSKLITEHQGHGKDTGSAQVQIALLTREVEELTRHLKQNPKDEHSRRGLLKMVADRRTHQKYMDKQVKKKEALKSKAK